MLYLFLILLTIPGIISAVWRIVDQQKCPDENELQKAVLGKQGIKKPKAELIIQHLGICKKCREKVDHLNKSSS